MEIEVKTAVFEKLNIALNVKIYNGAPLDALLPYVDIDEWQNNDWSTKTFTGSRPELRIHVWHKDRDECSRIISRIRTALDWVELPLQGVNFVDCRYISDRSMTDADGITRHGVIDFEILAHT
ncbi:MAG: DUF3168 domain-containing protein [Emcibacter sp.]|nr:DUF3168 domain-containing protein [Emcibacter sp.]